MAIVTDTAHIDNAVHFYQRRDGVYLALARSNTPWSNEEVPPDEDKTATSLIETYGYKKCDVNLARPLKEGEDVGVNRTVTFKGKTWVLVEESQAYAEGANYIYIKGEVMGDELPLQSYRQAGIHSGLTLNPNVTSLAVLPTEVNDAGKLLFYVNRKEQKRADDIRNIEAFMVKF